MDRLYFLSSLNKMLRFFPFAQLLEYFNVETKKHVLDKTRLVKCLRDADQFLGDLCGRITQGYRRKNDVIISLIKEVEEKNRVVKVSYKLNILHNYQ